MNIIKILGGGCANCHRLEAITREATADLKLEAEFVLVTQHEEIMKYPILSTPALVVNEKVLVSGRVPAKSEIVELLKSI
jgi:small redox-active disulfide protein 2